MNQIGLFHQSRGCVFLLHFWEGILVIHATRIIIINNIYCCTLLFISNYPLHDLQPTNLLLQMEEEKSTVLHTTDTLYMIINTLLTEKL